MLWVGWKLEAVLEQSDLPCCSVTRVLFQWLSRLDFLTKVLHSITFGGFRTKVAVLPLKGSGVLLKQHCSITLATAQQGKSGSASTYVVLWNLFSLSLWSKQVHETFLFPNQLQPVSDAIFFHMHGGGFIAQTSKSHQSYLRQWSRNLNMPIFSVDYSLAPQAPFPRWDHNIHDMCTCTYVSMTVPNISTYHYFCSITEKYCTSLHWIVDSTTYDELITWFHEFWNYEYTDFFSWNRVWFKFVDS